MSEIRYALRALTRRPGPTLVVVATLGIAIASATVIVSVVDTVWHLVPVVNRDRLVYIAGTQDRIIQTAGGARGAVMRTPASAPDLADWRARATTFEQLAGFRLGSMNLTGIDVPMRVTSVGVTANLPELWGYAPALGRSFRGDEGQPGAARVVLLSHSFWQRQFSASPRVLGRSLLLDAVPHTIVGVLPPEAGTGIFRNVEVFTTLVIDPLRGGRRDVRDVMVTGRLRTGVSLEQAAGELDAIAGRLRTEHPDTNRQAGAAVLPLIESSGFNVRVLLTILLLIGLLIMVVACANIASVIVAQSMTRRHELAVHSALGATRADRIRWLMTESAILSIAGGTVGVILAAWGIVAFRWLAGDALGFNGMEMNGRVFAVSLVVAGAAPFGFGLLPALRITPPDPQELRDGARAAGATRRGRRLRHAIVGVQAAAAMMLMVQIGLFLRTTWKLDQIPSGFEPAGVLTFRVGLDSSRYGGGQAIDRFVDTLTTRLRALPGVASMGVVDRLPVADREQTARLAIEGRDNGPLDSQPLVARTAIAGDYLRTLQIPVTRGRVFSGAEVADAAPVAVLNEEAARRFWPGGDPLGARITTGAGQNWLEVVGVVGDLRNSDIDQGTLPQVYVPLSRQPSTELAVVVKSSGPDPLSLVPAVRALVAGIDTNQPVHDVATMSKVLFDDLASTYVLSAILTAIGFIALVLSAAGIYGLVSHSVAQRRREIGVRMALGARSDWIVRMIFLHTSKPVVVGSAAGLVAAGALALALAAAVPEVEARDPTTYLVVLATIVAVTALASYLPARRAARINPVDALRAE